MFSTLDVFKLDPMRSDAILPLRQTSVLIGASDGLARTTGLKTHDNGEAILAVNRRDRGIRFKRRETGILDVRSIATKTSSILVTVDLVSVWSNRNVQVPMRIVNSSNSDIYAVAEYVMEVYGNDPCATLLIFEKPCFWNESTLLRLGFFNCGPQSSADSSVFAKLPEGSPINIMAQLPQPLKNGLNGSTTQVIIALKVSGEWIL